MKSDLKNAAVVVETRAADDPGALIPVSTIWTTSAPATQVGYLTGVTLSPGTNIWITPSTSNPRGGFCLQAYNLGASEATGTLRIMYYSLQGGLQSTLAGAGSGCA